MTKCNESLSLRNIRHSPVSNSFIKSLMLNIPIFTEATPPFWGGMMEFSHNVTNLKITQRFY